MPTPNEQHSPFARNRSTNHQPSSRPARHFAQLFVVVVSAMALGCAAEIASEEEIGSTSAEVHVDTRGSGYGYVREDTRVSRSTASIQTPFRDGNGVQGVAHGVPLRGTCGATFISPHYAITAAHCVDQGQVPNPTTDTTRVEFYNIEKMNVFGLAFSSILNGRFPGYERPIPVENLSGYEVESHDCTVKARCDFGSFGCSFNGDIALLFCPTRTGTDYMPIASAGGTTGPVEMYWFHEMLNISSDVPRYQGNILDFIEARDRYDHYTTVTPGISGYSENYHYHGGGRNAMLPLVSTPWDHAHGGGERRRLGGIDRLGGRVRTDLYGCHGSSGSGVFQRNAAGELELLGPVSRGGSWASTRLCNDPNTFEPGDTGLSYTSNTSTRRLVSDHWRTLWRDRTLIALPPVRPVARR